MRAVVVDELGAPNVLHVAEVARPTRVNAEFLIKVVAAGVNPIDAKTRAGRGASGAIAQFPVILGNDFSGIVVESPGSRQTAPLAVISRLLDSGDVRVYVDQVFDLADAVAAHEALETGHTRGKIVLTVSNG